MTAKLRLSCAAVFCTALFAIAAGTTPTAADTQSVTIDGSLRILDGDTLEIGPMLIRLHGIDAPEKGQKCASRDGDTWRCGAAAVNRLEELVAGSALTCDPLSRDPYGRIIARCHAGGTDIAATLINEGLAWAFAEYSQDYVSLEQTARTQNAGIWQAPTQTPWEFRDDKWNRALANAPDGRCPIKGNIGAKGTRIYHTPWSPNYTNTKINTDKGERWFCDEAEALAAGWRPVQGR